MPKRVVKKKVPGTENNKRLKKSRKENANLTECPPCEGVFISIKSSPKYYNSDMEDAYGIDNVAKIIKKEPASSDDVDNVVKTIKKEHAPDEKILPDEGQSEIEVVYEIDNIAKIVKNEPVMSEEFKNNSDANEYSQSNDEFSCEEGFQTVPVRQISGLAKHRKNGTKQNPRKKSNTGKEHAIIQANSTTDKAKIVPTTSTTANDFSTTAEYAYLVRMAPRKRKHSKEDILKKKREAERKRYERNKNDPQKREEFREKERLKYIKKKERGTRKLVKDMTPQEHREAKRKWREHCNKYRNKKKVSQDVTGSHIKENMSDSEASNPSQPPIPEVAEIYPKKNNKEQLVRYKITMDKDEEINFLKKELLKYKKRLSRLKKKENTKPKDAPIKKLENMAMDTNAPEPTKDLVKTHYFVGY